MNQGVMLNAYPDSLGGSLAAEADFLARKAEIETRLATESDVVLAFESRSDADEYAGEHDGMAVLPVPCAGAYEYPSEKSATDWDRIADALPKGGEQA